MAHQNAPSTFLSLAPNTSDSYPRAPKAKSAGTPPTSAVLAAEGKPRTSSVESDGAKNPSMRRFLKLGPVHWGEHQDDDHKGDWHEVAVK